MKQNKLKYKLLWLLILIWGPMLLYGQRSFKELPDSLRLNIRIHSHLLITQEKLSADFINQFNGHVPLAFKLENILSSDHQKLIEQVSQNQKYTLLISPEPQTLKLQSKNLIFINPKDVDTYSLSKNEEADSIHHQKLTTNELLFLKIKNEQAIKDSAIFKLWEQTGKLPNLIQAKKEHTLATIELIQQLNSKRKIYGVIQSEGQLVADVLWKEYPKRKTNGYFCFPDQSPITPYKAGYQFSPDIIYNSPTNWNKIKEFNAIKLSPDYLLNEHFSFAKEIKNLKRNNKDEILNKGVEIVKDKTKGSVAHFSGETYIDGGIQSREILKSNFSVTAWIKPTQIDENNSILGKGRDFVLKISNGSLTYTMQGVKDYFAKNAEIPVNQWTFISLVHSANENQMRFYMNGELADQVNLIEKYRESDYTLLIGSNLWEQFFVGYMSDIKIWERELNNDEIREQFNLSSGSKNKASLLSSFLLFAIFGFAVILFFILSKKIKKRSATTSIKENKPKQKLPESGASEKIICFGGLQVINKEGLDVAQRFSPKLKQLFVLIFLHSINGQKGINSSKLSGYLWPGMDPKNVKNTRGTNVQKLKAALGPCSEIRLVFKDKHWLLEMSGSCYSDYSNALAILNSINVSNDELMKELPSLLTILKRGTLFPNMSESWIDNYSSKISDQVIELGLSLFQKLNPKKDAALLYELAEVISIYDPLNEPALKIKLSLLTQQGKLGLARSLYDSFTKLYFELYQEQYAVDFKTHTHSTSEKK